MDQLRGGVAGGSVLRGVLKVRDSFFSVVKCNLDFVRLHKAEHTGNYFPISLIEFKM